MLQRTEATASGFHTFIPMDLGNIAALSKQLLNDMTMFNGLAKIKQIQTRVIRLSKTVLSLQNMQGSLTQKTQQDIHVSALTRVTQRPEVQRSYGFESMSQTMNMSQSHYK